jgi:hypothetical protein
MNDLTTAQLRQALAVREKIDGLESELAQLFGGASAQPQAPVRGTPWARVKRQTTLAAVKPKRRTMSASGRARIAAAARKRWRKAKAAGKRTLGG